MATCKSCGAPIVWAITEAGKAMPVDKKPVPDGNLVLGKWSNGPHEGKPSVTVVDSSFPPGQRFVSHFSSCPQANEHRKER